MIIISAHKQIKECLIALSFERFQMQAQFRNKDHNQQLELKFNAILYLKKAGQLYRKQKWLISKAIAENT